MAFPLNDGVAVTADDLPLVLVEAGDTVAAAGDYAGCSPPFNGWAGDLVYVLTLDTPAMVSIAHAFDMDYMMPVVYVYGGECIADNLLECDVASGEPAKLSNLALLSGIYFIVVDGLLPDLGGPYTLTVDVGVPPPATP